MSFSIFGPHVDPYLFAISTFLFFQIFRQGLRKVALSLAKKTTSTVDDDILDAVKRPVDFLFVIIGAYVAKTFLYLDDDLSLFLDKLLRSGFIIVLFWALVEVLNHMAIHIHKISNRFGDKISPSVANFALKSTRFFIIIIAFIAVLQEWGFNVSGFLASLGLVGMAFALAAKDTAANLFGSLVIFTDKPFDVGDWIMTPQVEGIIETVGVRSTKVRTFAQALVTVPNATLANSAILNWSRMGKRRVKMNIGITYDTKGETVAKIVDDIRSMLENHPDIHQETIHIYFSEFNSSSLDIFCYYFTISTNWGEFMKVRQDTFLKIMKIVEQNGAHFAFPTQTVHLEQHKEEMVI